MFLVCIYRKYFIIRKLNDGPFQDLFFSQKESEEDEMGVLAGEMSLLICQPHSAKLLEIPPGIA
jgi:hypothetical protein